MSNGISTDITGNPVQLDTQSDVQLKVQDMGQHLYYRTKIHKNYKDSIERNPNLEIAWQIFVTGDKPKEGVYLLRVNEGDSSYYVYLDDDIDYLNKQYADSFRSIQVTEDESYERSPEIHDWCVDGLKMDWKRANELYKKLMGEK